MLRLLGPKTILYKAFAERAGKGSPSLGFLVV